jgi:hypothetical protein
MTRDTKANVAWLRNSTEHSLGNSAVGTVCVCCVCCVCLCAVCSRLCCGTQPFAPDRLLLPPSIEVSTASLRNVTAQLAVLDVMTSESMCTHAHRSDDTGTSRYSTYIARNREKQKRTFPRSWHPSQGRQHSYCFCFAFICLAAATSFNSVLGQWKVFTPRCACLAVSAGTDPPAEWTDKQTTLQLHCTQRGSILIFANKPINNFTLIFTVVPCSLVLSKSFIYQLMHNRVALKEY